ncbi:unnamed protein product [Phytophthora fragariaefolia]|uniref:Unnamed protein product n=1 Tax=Phytophthora fragariaefolia TaxID=1490495 RepID=A0A9W7DBR6_9STRA|nr:unnamed protein product [Phytophthora fragariaefolia]
MDASKVKVSRSMKLDEREVGGIYDSHSPHHGTVIHLTKDADAPTIPVASERYAVQDEPMEAVEEPAQDVVMADVEPEQEALQLPPSERFVAPGLELAEYRPPPQAFQDDRLVFRPVPVRSRRSQERLFLLENGNDERKSEDSDGPPTPKRPRINEDGLIAEAIREVKDVLKNAFKVKELGTVKFILVMEIDHDQDAGTLMIKQTRYIDDVVEQYGQQAAKPVDNPCTSVTKGTVT